MLIYTGANTIFNHEYKKELHDLLSKDKEVNKNPKVQTIDKKIISSGLGDILEIINFCLTLILIIFYIICTYTYPETSNIKKKMNSVIDIIELYIVVYLLAHFLIKLYINKQKIIFLLEYTTLIDLASIIMIIFSKTDIISYEIKFFFRVFRIIRVLYLSKIEIVLQKNSNETVLITTKLIISFISLVFISISLILEIENYYFRKENGNDSTESTFIAYNGKGYETLMTFHDAIYFGLVTLTTEGYGDITPRIWISRYIIIFTVLAFIFIIKPIHSKFGVLMEITKYSKMKYRKNSGNTKHILVLGECGIESYLAFLEELYNADHGETNHDIVIMQRRQDKELMNLIKSFSYAPNIFYFVGNSLIEKDLKRCQAEKSICAVILANRLAKNKKMEDFSNIMKAFSIKKFHRMYWKEKDEKIRICIQILRPETKEMCYSSLFNEDEINSGNTQIICVEEIKLQLLSKSCLCPGITTIVASLITSKKPTIEENFDLLSLRHYGWIREYLNGIQQEIYFIKIKAELVHNLKFIDIVKLIYKVSGLIVIGIDVIIDDFKPLVCLNPANYVIAPFDTLIYILADRQPDGNELNNLIENYLERQEKGIVAKNKEMTKLLRLKNYFWNKIANIPDYFHNKEMQSSLGIKFSNQNVGNVFKKNNKNNKNFSQMSFKNKNFLLLKQGNSSDYQSPMYLKNFYLQKLERYSQIRQDFFYTVLPRPLQKAENFNLDNLNNHIIICGISINLKNLLMPLRASSMKIQQYPILIMDKRDHIPNEIWKEIEYYPDVYYIQGNPMKSKDLQRAGVKKAKAVIILSKSGSNNESNSNMVDMDTIFIYKAIKNEIKGIKIIAELISSSALSFLNSENNDENIIKEQGYWLSPSFAVGEIFVGSMLDTLICQAFYNPFITNIIRQLIMGSAGSNFSSIFQNKLNEKKISQSTLYLLPIKEELNRLGYKDYKKTMFYRELFDFFVKNNMVPIGLYRNNKGISFDEKIQPYVYMCPGKEDLVEVDRDQIYLLANERNFAQVRTRRERASRRASSYIQMNTASRLIDKSNELTLNLVQKIKKVVNTGNQKLRNNFSINKMTGEVRESMRNELNNMYDDLVGNKIEKFEEDKK